MTLSVAGVDLVYLGLRVLHALLDEAPAAAPSRGAFGEPLVAVAAGTRSGPPR